MESFLVQVGIGVASAIAFSFLLFLWIVYFRGANLVGEWVALIKVRESSYRPFIGLKAEFRFHLLRDGTRISGTGEKISNSNHNAPDTVYEHINRPIVQIEGTYTKKYFSRDEVVLTIVENGIRRQSRATYHLKFTSKNEFNGNFESTAANANGDVKLKIAKTYFK